MLPLCELSTFRALTRVLSPSFSRADGRAVHELGNRGTRHLRTVRLPVNYSLYSNVRHAGTGGTNHAARNAKRSAHRRPGRRAPATQPAKKLTSRGRGAVALFLRGQRGRPDPVVGETSHRIADNCAVVVKAWYSCFSARSIMAADPPRARRSRRQTQSFRVGRQWTTPALS